MNLFARLGQRLGLRASPENPSTSLANPAAWLVDWMTGPRASSGVAVGEETALGATAVYRAVSILAETIGSLPLHVYERGDNGARRLRPDHPVQAVIDQPNPHHTRMGWLECMLASQALWGNSYDFLQFDRRGRLVELLPLLPGKTHPIRDGRTVKFEHHLPGGERLVLRADEVAHVPWLGTDGLAGKSPIRLHRESIGLALAAESFGARFFGSGSKPSGVLQSPQNLSAEVVALIREQWAQTQAGLDNAHKLAVLPNGLTWQAIGVNPEDAQFLETRQFQVVEVARIYGVPPHLLGALERATFSNVEEQDINFVRHSIRPRCVRIEQVLNRRLFNAEERGRLYVQFSLEGLLRGDSAARSAFYREMWGIGAMSVNEIRGLENLNPVDGGDERYVPLNMVPVSQAAQLLEADDDAGGERARRAARLRELRGAQRRSVGERQRIQGAHRRLLGGPARRVVERELARVRRAMPGLLDDLAGLRQWLRDFYRDHRDYITRQFTPPIAALGEQIDAAARAEVGGEPDPAQLEAFVASYVEAFALRTAASARNQLLAITDEHEGAPAEQLGEALEARLGDWEETRAERIASREVVEAGGAFAAAAYAAVGVTLIRWVTVGDNCPLCDAMDNKVVGVRQSFLEAGDTVKPAGEEAAPLTTRRAVGHPPLHQGCNCTIVAEV